MGEAKSVEDENMNVKQLREFMKDLPDEAPVLVWDCYYDSGYREADEVSLQAVLRSEGDYSYDLKRGTPIPVLAIT